MDESIMQFSTFYSNLSASLETRGQKMEPIYRIASKILVKVQKFIEDKDALTELPCWFKCITQSIKLTNPSLSLIAIESMIEILISEKVDIVYEKLKNLIVDATKIKIHNFN